MQNLLRSVDWKSESQTRAIASVFWESLDCCTCFFVALILFFFQINSQKKQTFRLTSTQIPVHAFELPRFFKRATMK